MFDVIKLDPICFCLFICHTTSLIESWKSFYCWSSFFGKFKKIATFEYNYYLKFCNRQNNFFHYIWLIIRLFQNVMAADLNIKWIWLKCTSLKCLISRAYWLLNVCVIFGPWLIEHLLAVKFRLQASLSYWIPPTEALWNMLIFDICSNNEVEHVLLVKNTQFQA